VLLEIQENRLEAQKFYRAALDIDPTYKPAWANLARATSFKVGTIGSGAGRPGGRPLRRDQRRLRKGAPCTAFLPYTMRTRIAGIICRC
jgi:hypothetical protein